MNDEPSLSDVIAIVKRTEQHAFNAVEGTRALRAEFKELKATWPIPRSIRVAVWLMACALVVIAFGSVVSPKRKEQRQDAVETAARYGGGM